MATKKISIGHTDCTPLTANESGLGRSCIRRRFNTLKQAHRFQEHLASVNNKGLLSGKYYLDMPYVG